MKSIDAIMDFLGHVPKEKANRPETPFSAGDMARPKNNEYPDVEIVAVGDHSVTYRLPNGRTETRCKRGFVKNYSRSGPGRTS
jgi:hypothetical protein